MGEKCFRGYETGLGFHTYETSMKPGTQYETSPPDNRYETVVKPSPKTIFVGSKSETGYETEPQKDLFEAGLKPGMKPQNSNQGETDYWYETAKLKPSRLWYETDYETGMKPKGGANLNSLRHLPLCTKPPLDNFFQFNYETDRL